MTTASCPQRGLREARDLFTIQFSVVLALDRTALYTQHTRSTHTCNV